MFKLFSKISVMVVCFVLAGNCMAGVSEFELWKIKKHFDEQINSSELDLSLKILKRHYEKKDDNVFVSPFSIYFMSVMLANGATDQTYEELKNILFAPRKDGNLQDINEKIGKYIKYMPSTLEISSSLWGDNLKVEYKKLLSETFQTETKQLPETTKDINKWVNKKTKGKISSVLEEQNTQKGSCYIVNTVYFNDVWYKDFDKEATILMPFKSLNATSEDDVYMMRKHAKRTDYFENDKIQAIRLLYKNGHSIQILLPKKNYDFLTFIKELDVNDLNIEYSSAEGNIYLPKFEIDFALDNMSEFFKGIGIKRIFDPVNSQLGGMSDENLFVNKIIHVAKVKVDEKGTEAAAATVTEIEKGGIPDFHRIKQIFEFKADHPFIFVIDSGLFVGAYVKGSKD